MDSGSRLADFKSNLGTGNDVTRRHRDDAKIERRNKRNDKLDKVRGNSNTNFASLKKAYESAPGPATLDALLEHCTPDQYATLALGDPLKLSLVSMIPDPIAIRCLTNIFILEPYENYVQQAEFFISKTPLRANIIQYVEQKPQLWCIVAHLASSCVEARNAIFFSTPLSAMFLQSMPQPHLLIVAHSLYASQMHPPPIEFSIQLWPKLLQAEDLFSINAIIRCERYNAQTIYNLLTQSHNILIPMLVRMVSVRQIDALSTLANLGAFAVPGGWINKAIFDAGGFPLILMHIDNPKEKVARECIVWMDNYASESIENIVQLLQNSEAWKKIMIRIRSGSLVEQCMGVMETIIVKLCANRSDENIVPYNDVIFATMDNIRRHGRPRLHSRILTIWEALLHWNSKIIFPMLKERGTFDVVAELLDSRDNFIFTKAEAIMKYEDENEHSMEIE